MATSMENVTIEELEERLATFNEQLSSITEILDADPENTEFQTIAKDLREVIDLTTQMLNMKKEPKYPIGSHCEVLHEEKWYPAIVTNVKQPIYIVTFYGFGTLDERDASTMRRIASDPSKKPVDSSLITVDMECQAKYYVDEKFYPCKVQQITSNGYKIKFTEYGNVEEVPLEYMYYPDLIPKAVKGKEKKPATYQPLKIPENLTILATDTQEEKDRKRKRIRAIKSINRHKGIDQERDQKQAGWKAFQSKKKLKKKTSIFTSPDTIDGRVGVVGSGQGMTDYENTRKKYKLK